MLIRIYQKFQGTTQESEIVQVGKKILQYSNQDDLLILTKQKLSVFLIGIIKVNMLYNFKKHRTNEHLGKR